MQIETVQKFQQVLDITIKAVKFTWRHLFVITLLVLIVNTFIEAEIPVINWEPFMQYLAVAIALDWFKTKIKFSGVNNSQNRYHQAAAESFRRHSEWETNPAKIGSPAHHIYNLGYNNGKYY